MTVRKIMYTVNIVPKDVGPARITPSVRHVRVQEVTRNLRVMSGKLEESCTG